jgi:predicted alpha/beta superfamily hydrolase
MSLRLELSTAAGDSRPVYITGTFNNWQVGSKEFQLKEIEPGKYTLDFPASVSLPPIFEYKYTRGDWGHVEVDEFGNRIKNRKLNHTSGKVYDFVPRWRLNGSTFNPTFLPKIQRVSNGFHIPQLNKNRKVSILLPHNYYETNYHYPVLYMQDGQNLFDKNAPFGTWGIDEKLAVLAEQGMGDIIVVGIDHGNEKRINEYTPANELPIGIGHGEGAKYLKFMVNNLKPHIDQNFRTLTDRANTAVGGSSMGGLISHYAALYHSDTFSKVMVFSPSFWIHDEVYKETEDFNTNSNTRFYLFGGAKEGSNMVENMFHIRDILQEKQQENQSIKFKLVIDPEGQHTESRWHEEFPRAIAWLFYGR